MTVSLDRVLRLALIVLLLAGTVSAQEGPPPAIVETSTVTSERITESVELAGTVRAILDSALVFGIITPAEQTTADHLADRVCAMGYKLFGTDFSMDNTAGLVA